jgi:hypothetical protein
MMEQPHGGVQRQSLDDGHKVNDVTDVKPEELVIGG